MELRDKKALAYSVSSFSTEGYAPGLLGGYIAYDVQQAVASGGGSYPGPTGAS